jgi:16S rRNA (guanine527-N7)-methyltransferase
VQQQVPVASPVRADLSASGPAVPAVPAAARAALGDALPVLERYAALLAGPGVERGLLGPRETPRLWERHLLNCAGPADLLEAGSTVADVGSGAGLPGLVLAALRPDCRFVLVEPLLRRATFLTEAVALLELPQVEVRRARAEELAGLDVDDVVARAVAPLDRLAGWTLPLLRPGGRLVALKGEGAAAELAAAEAALRALGAVDARVVEVGAAATLTAARAVVVVRGTPVAAPGQRTARRRGRR